MFEYARAEPQGNQMIAAVGLHGQNQATVFSPLKSYCQFFIVRYVPKIILGGHLIIELSLRTHSFGMGALKRPKNPIF